MDTLPTARAEALAVRTLINLGMVQTGPTKLRTVAGKTVEIIIPNLADNASDEAIEAAALAAVQEARKAISRQSSRPS